MATNQHHNYQQSQAGTGRLIGMNAPGPANMVFCADCGQEYDQLAECFTCAEERAYQAEQQVAVRMGERLVEQRRAFTFIKEGGHYWIRIDQPIVQGKK